ncbi:beta-ketoacyl synthase chain length factor [Noviherbaspirillum sedimenti]|uniref:3-oxoacyl-ACP synthase n=1 Tax=Noviherbaspirillum sedimenti TaxID=2320865 RepID=A0A3A3G4Y2_9BURK|nr:beta-ketoacyl synthase chain length factor [Noviherbaspirillum sedimenti]RJG02735.1 3-oxoacyl-ACP synthase [Noviherbaspirillum sedimenti]
MRSAIEFSIICDAAWAPGIETREAWRNWARGQLPASADSEPVVRAMPAMQRRRLGLLGKMALEVAYECLGQRQDVPTVFCSRHGEVSRSVELLRDLAHGEPLSPTSFGMSVHNAVGGMFSIARGDVANNIALSGGRGSIEHALIEACGLLADGEKAVLLVVYDCPLPAVYADFQDEDALPFAWAWLIEPPREDVISLSWHTLSSDHAGDETPPATSLDVLRFFLRRDPCMERIYGRQSWRWTRHVS